MANLNGMGPNEEGMGTGRGLGNCEGKRPRRNMNRSNQGCRRRGGYRNNPSFSNDRGLDELREEIQSLRSELSKQSSAENN